MHMMQKCRTRTDENKIDHIARLAGKIFGKTRILSCNCYTLKQYLDNKLIRRMIRIFQSFIEKQLHE